MSVATIVVVEDQPDNLKLLTTLALQTATAIENATNLGFADLAAFLQSIYDANCI